MILQILQKVAEVREGVLIYYIGKGYFLAGHNEKGYQTHCLG